MYKGIVENIRMLVARARIPFGLLDGVKRAFEGIPGWAAVLIIGMLPIFELRGAIPFGTEIMGMKLWQAFLWAVLGNMIPIPFILMFLEPFSKWLSRHFKTMDRFFTWLFARTRRKHSASFERWQHLALMIFVAIPLPVTGAWSGAVAAFVFGIPFWPALFYIFLGVLIAGGVVSLATSFAGILGWQGSLIAAVVLTAFLIWLFNQAKRDRGAGSAETDA